MRIETKKFEKTKSWKSKILDIYGSLVIPSIL